MTDIVVPDSLAFELGKSDKSIIQRQILKNNPNILGVKAAIEMERAKVKRSKLNECLDFVWV